MTTAPGAARAAHQAARAQRRAAVHAQRVAVGQGGREGRAQAAAAALGERVAARGSGARQLPARASGSLHHRPHHAAVAHLGVGQELDQGRGGGSGSGGGGVRVRERQDCAELPRQGGSGGGGAGEVHHSGHKEALAHVHATAPCCASRASVPGHAAEVPQRDHQLHGRGEHKGGRGSGGGSGGSGGAAALPAAAPLALEGTTSAATVTARESSGRSGRRSADVLARGATASREAWLAALAVVPPRPATAASMALAVEAESACDSR